MLNKKTSIWTKIYMRFIHKEFDKAVDTMINDPKIKKLKKDTDIAHQKAVDELSKTFGNREVAESFMKKLEEGLENGTIKLE